MSLSKHFKEHCQIGLFGASNYTVGSNQMFSTVVAALAHVATLATISDEITEDCSSVEVNGSGTLDKRLIKADSGTPFSVFDVGQIVGVEVGGSGCPVLAVVYSDTTILMKHPIRTDLSATSCVVGIPLYKAVTLMPGHTEEITSEVLVPSFTSIEALVRGTTMLKVTAGTAIFGIEATANETRFKKLGMISAGTGAIRVLSYTAVNYQGDTYLEELDGFSTAQDYAYFTPGVHGGVHVINCNVTSGYDVLRLGQHREVNVLNNVFDAFSVIGASYGQASAIAIGTTATPATLPVENYNIKGNELKAFGQDVITGVVVHGDVRAIDLRNRCSSAAQVIIANNSIYATGDDAGAVVGFSVTGNASGETPTITSIGNTFDVRNDGAGSQLSMDSAQANYTIDRAGNVQLSGCTLGSNTAALTTV